MEIPWAKLYLGPEELEEVVDSIKSSWISKGPKVAQFEEKVKNLLGTKHAIAVNSGTAALDMALKILDIGYGDEVIVPAFAYIATANAVLYQHATPVFADVNPETFNLDPDDVQRKISSRTKAIIVIDYGGQGADFVRLRKVLAGKKIYLIEDAAPAFGGEQRGKKLCTFGDISITSFHTAKSFTSVEGGMLFTESDELATKSRIFLNQGEDFDHKYHHPLLGHNYRLSDLHAAVGLAQVARFTQVLEKRTAVADYYTAELNRRTSLIKTPLVLPENKHGWFLYPVLVDHRDEVYEKLKEKGISANISWPKPIYEQPYFKRYFRERCPAAEMLTRRILCLPLYFAMTRQEQDYVIDALVSIVSSLSTSKGR